MTAPPPIVSTSYGSDPLQTVEWVPSAKTSSPVAVMVHGGGFHSSSGDAHKLTSNAKLLRSFGITTAIANVRADVAIPAFPAQVDDVVAAVGHVIANAATFHGDGTRVSLVGGSSGGTLVSDAAVQLLSSVKNVFVLSGTEDLGAALVYWGDGTHGPLGKQHIKELGQALDGQSPAAYSPVLLASSALVGQHWRLFASQDEEPIVVTMAMAMTTALRAAGVDVASLTLTGSAHAYDYWSVVADPIAQQILNT